MSDTFTVSDTQSLEPADICISWVSGTDWIWDLAPISPTGFTQNSNQMKIVFCSNTESAYQMAKHFSISHDSIAAIANTVIISDYIFHHFIWSTMKYEFF